MSVFAITAGNLFCGEINVKHPGDIEDTFAGEGDYGIAFNRNDRLFQAGPSDVLPSPGSGRSIWFPVPGKYDTIDIGTC